MDAKEDMLNVNKALSKKKKKDLVAYGGHIALHPHVDSHHTGALILNLGNTCHTKT